ncbi:hypothetical protein T265_15085, partial [Opisthorchis viverrini]
MEKALKANVDEVAVFTAASEKFSKTNINCTIDESMKNIEQVDYCLAASCGFLYNDPIEDFSPSNLVYVLQLAKEHDIPVRGYVSCVIGCPYEGAVAPDAVARVAEMLWSRGCYEISLGDTIGVGTPESMAALLSVVLDCPGACPREAVAVHCHDTGGNALKNIRVALDDYKVNIVDSSIAGLGGCPYAGPNAPGNVATEAVVAQLVNLGYSLSPQIRTEDLISVRTNRMATGRLADPDVRRTYKNRLLESLRSAPPSDVNSYWDEIATSLHSVGNFSCGTTHPGALKHWISDRTVALLKSQRNIPAGPEHDPMRRAIRRQVK